MRFVIHWFVVLGTSCREVACANAEKYGSNYNNMYSYDKGYYCNVDNVCSCEAGYKEGSDGNCQKGENTEKL